LTAFSLPHNAADGAASDKPAVQDAVERAEQQLQSSPCPAAPQTRLQQVLLHHRRPVRQVRQSGAM